MAESKLWKTLHRGIEVLRKQFLPETFDPLGRYPKSMLVQAQTRAFLVLSHAEIEGYFESWAKDIARACEVRWNASAKPTAPLSYLLTTNHAQRMNAGEKDAPVWLSDAASKAFQKYYVSIKDNNGIKEVNVLALFSPLGVPASAIGTALLASLDSLGALRGEHAHNSSKAVRSVLDPETEYRTIRNVVDDLKSFDGWLVSYRKKVR